MGHVGGEIMLELGWLVVGEICNAESQFMDTLWMVVKRDGETLKRAMADDARQDDRGSFDEPGTMCIRTIVCE